MRRYAVVLIYLLLWGAVLFPMLQLLGELMQLNLSNRSLPETILRTAAIATMIPAIVLPFCVFPFALLVKTRKQGFSWKLSRLLRESPLAFARCAKAGCYATVTLCVLAAPPIAGIFLLHDIAVSEESSTFALGTAITANFLIWGLLGREILGRITYPILRVFIDCPPREALALARELSKRRFIVLSAYLILGVVGFIMLASMYQTGAEIIFKPVFFLSLAAAWISFLAFALSLIVAQAAEERGRERLEWLLDANVSAYSIRKLARAGYFLWRQPEAQ